MDDSLVFASVPCDLLGVFNAEDDLEDGFDVPPSKRML